MAVSAFTVVRTRVRKGKRARHKSHWEILSKNDGVTVLLRTRRAAIDEPAELVEAAEAATRSMIASLDEMHDQFLRMTAAVDAVLDPETRNRLGA